jgi:hypothetical protein
MEKHLLVHVRGFGAIERSIILTGAGKRTMLLPLFSGSAFAVAHSSTIMSNLVGLIRSPVGSSISITYYIGSDHRQDRFVRHVTQCHTRAEQLAEVNSKSANDGVDVLRDRCDLDCLTV